MPVTALEHATIRCSRLAETRDFYCRVLGLEDGARPAFPFRGHWLYLGGVPVIHLVEAADTKGAWGAGRGGHAESGHNDGGPADTGPFDHIAFQGDDFDAMRGRLVTENRLFRERIVPGGALKQLFVPDPEGVLVEINFRA